MSPETSAESPLLRDALEIWHAGVAAVDSARLVRNQIVVDGDVMHIAGERWTAGADSRICVVGAGKAGAGMALGFEQAIGEKWLSRTSGWINVPADCVQTLSRIHLHAARPAGLNEPTEAGAAGSLEILRQVGELKPDDLCIVLISGGGSALLPAPIEGITLGDKLAITRSLMRQGATIDELNCVRRNLSAIKGGGLLRACRAGKIISLIISDVIGDPLETIASGPTIPCRPEPQRAATILKKFSAKPDSGIPPHVVALLESRVSHPEVTDLGDAVGRSCNVVIGNNRTAVNAAADRARTLGYEVVSQRSDLAGEAAPAGRAFAQELLAAQRLQHGGPKCLLSGGETTVQLAETSKPQKGGRNQEFALAALVELLAAPEFTGVLVSAGTDGEDGPTDAAGAYVSPEMLHRVREGTIDPQEYLAINNSYPFFEQFGGLLKTGPTHTNVMDLRVGVTAGEHQPD